MRVAIIALVLTLLSLVCGPVRGAEVDSSDEAVKEAIDRGVAFLLEAQNEDGSWGGVRNATFISRFANPATYRCWQVATTALAVQALLETGRGPDAESAVDRGLDYLVVHGDLKRPAEWDVDNVWGLVYGLEALAQALKHPRYQNSDKTIALRAGAETMIAGLARYISPRGGWGYYAGPNSAWRPEWATSFTTAVGVIALVDAKEAGLEVPDKVLNAAVRLVEHCRLPNGAYSYSADAIPRHLYLESVDQVKGSLGRIQVCNYALHRAGGDLPEGAMEKGIEQFFLHHKFLDVGRNKPIPHEAYYAVAAYFYLFGQYYAALVIEALPEETRGEYALKLRPEVLKCQQKDGSFWDFWIASMTKPYGTAFSVMALARTLEKDPMDRLADMLEAHRIRYDLPGVNLGFVLPDGQEGAVAVGYSDLESEIPLAAIDRLLAGSIGKTYVSAVALQLAGEGKLDLDAKIIQYLGEEEWFQRLPNGPDITVRMLMNHTSGIQEHVHLPTFGESVAKDKDRVWKPAEILEYILDSEPLFPPGEGWSYADTNYIVLGVILEKITGSTYYDELQRRVLTPLGLKDTVPSDNRAIPRLAPGYAKRPSPFLNEGKTMRDGKLVLNPQVEWTGGGLATTALDLARWARLVYRGEAFPEALMGQLLEGVPATTGEGDRYGLGVQIWTGRHGTCIGHGGWFPGYLSLMAYYPDHNLAVAVQMNTDGLPKAGPGMRGIIDDAAQILMGD